MNKKFECNSDSIVIHTLKFYVSNLSFSDSAQKHIYSISDAILIDASQPETQRIFLPKLKNLQKINFGIGIDSLLNYNPIFTKDLDPTKGMYWTWQSGFINIKIEGDLIKNNGKEIPFQFHLGGFNFPNNCYRNAEYLLTSNELNIDLFFLLSKIDFEKTNKVMSPCKEAVYITDLFMNSIK